jgi:hypothetical protein
MLLLLLVVVIFSTNHNGYFHFSEIKTVTLWWNGYTHRHVVILYKHRPFYFGKMKISVFVPFFSHHTHTQLSLF